MKVLIDECLPGPLKTHLKGHNFTTVQAMGWGGVNDARLLLRAEGKFDMLLTGDKNLRHQQNLAIRKIAVVLLPTTHWPTLQQHLEPIQKAIDGVGGAAFLEVAFETSD